MISWRNHKFYNCKEALKKSIALISFSQLDFQTHFSPPGLMGFKRFQALYALINHVFWPKWLKSELYNNKPQRNWGASLWLYRNQR